jgi:hypothetical protein
VQQDDHRTRGLADDLVDQIERVLRALAQVIGVIRSGATGPFSIPTSAHPAVAAQAGDLSNIGVGFASTFGGLACPGFSDSAGVCDTRSR